MYAYVYIYVFICVYVYEGDFDVSYILLKGGGNYMGI